MNLTLRLFGVLLSLVLIVAPLEMASFAEAKEKKQISPLRFTVNEAILDELQSASLLAKTLDLPSATDAEIIAAAQADYQRMVLTLYESGYFNASVNIQINGREAADYSLFDKIGKVGSAAIIVNEGSVFLFGKAQISPLATASELPSEFSTGEVAKPSAIEDAADKAIRDWREDSHPKATITDQHLVADHVANTLDAELQVDPGRAAKFGTLTITGNQRMRTNRIKKIAGLPEGDDFTASQLKKSANRLRATGIFSSVILEEAEAISPEGFLDISADVTEAKLRQIGIDASISTDDGASLEAFWVHRNLLGGGEQLRFDVDLSGIGGDTLGGEGGEGGEDFEVGASLARPATLTPDTKAILYVNYGKDDEPNYTETALSVGLNFDHRFSDTLTGAAGIRYSNIDSDDAFGLRNFSLISLPLGLYYDTRSNKLTADDGVFLALDAAPFVDLKQSHSGVHTTFDGRTYKGFGGAKNIVLAGRLLLGSVIGPDLQDLPSSFLFYSGGSDSVRGHDFQALGITLPSGQTVGGKSFVGLSAELRSLITDKIGGVIFMDYGYIGPKSAFGVDGSSHTGMGLGAWYETPIGPIRVDLAVPADEGDKLKNLNIYIGIGQAF